MSHWPLSRQDIRRPAYRSLAQGIAAAIGSGALQPGDRLPTHRELAWRLDLSVQTVSRAYEELIRADLVSGEVGRGTFVRKEPETFDAMPWYGGDAAALDIDMSLMTPVHLPAMDAAWRRSLDRIVADLPPILVQGLRPEEVSEHYSWLAAEWLAWCGLVAGRRRVTITNGVTSAMFAALATVANPGEVIAADPYTSHMLGPAVQQLHLGLRAIEGDDRGMKPEALLRATEEAPGQIKAVYLLPNGAGPEARIIDKERRGALAAAALEAGVMILECDPLGPLNQRRPPPIARFAPTRTFYFTGLSKSLSPGLRLGFLVAPDSLVEPAVNRHTSMAWMATPLVAEIAADWLRTGTAERLLAAQRAELSARNRMAQRILGERSSGTRHGLHRWVPLPPPLTEAEAMSRLLARGIAVASGARFSIAGEGAALRICLGTGERAGIERALGEIHALLASVDAAA